MTAEDLKELVKEYKEIGQKLGKVVPQDPWDQLWAGIGAVFGSWMAARAITYRKLNNIPGDWGTAVNVQTMVFGNAGDDCATGVCFSRDPATGENVYYGEYLVNAQGEDVVAGIRTPQPMASKGDGTSLEEKWPHLYQELVDVRNKLEDHYKDMQDMEFTIEHGKLWMLQCRNGKRTAAAAVRMAVEMVEEGLLNKEEAIMRVGADQLDQLLHPMLDPKAEKKLLPLVCRLLRELPSAVPSLMLKMPKPGLPKAKKLFLSVTKLLLKTSAVCMLPRVLLRPAAV